MYFFDLKGQIEHLKAGKQTELESFQYVVGILLVSLFKVEMFIGRKEVAAWSPTIIIMYTIMGAIVGTVGYFVLRSYFRANGGENGKFFLHRLLALGWVIGWRAAIVLIPVSILALLLEPLGASGLVSGIVLLLIMISMLGMFIYIYVAMVDSFREVSGTPRKGKEPLLIEG